MVPTQLVSRFDAPAAGYREVSPLAAIPHLGELRLVDVREPDEFTGPLGHLPDAELVPLATLAASAEQWDRDTPVLLICRSGVRSVRAANALASMGFRNVFNLTGGMLAWEANAFPRLQGDDTPMTRLAAHVQACFVASAGDGETGKRAFTLAAAGEPHTIAGLRRALGLLRTPEDLAKEAIVGSVARLERRLAELA